MARYFFIFGIVLILSCKTIKDNGTKASFLWENATIYFLLTDRFNNGDLSNDFVHPSNSQPAPFRGYMGGDVKGITQKIKDGYFEKLGVNAIWMTPLVENIVGSVDEGTGVSYGFHGYWTRDWTAIDKRVGTAAEVREMVKTAHDHGIKIIFDAVVNHTGPVTSQDVKWPEDWVRTGPRCEYKDKKSTISCTLVDNLPDIKTEANQEVELPPHLIAKWKKEGRYEQEVRELDAFFARTNYPRKPYYYIIKWITDMITEFGIDGYRVDTAKHTEEEVWTTLGKEANFLFDKYKKEHPEDKQGNTPFYMVGEVYNYYINNNRLYDFGDQKVDYFANGFDALINFDFKSDAQKTYDEIFSKYNAKLNGPLKGKTVLNYISSHDDGSPFDANRTRSIESATKLLLSQGQAQIYYGDESGRLLNVEANGDAKLRSFMNWEEHSSKSANILNHWQKLGQFRNRHSAIGAGEHIVINKLPYIFARKYKTDKVVIGLDLPSKSKKIPCGNIFKDGEVLIDAYSGKSCTVLHGIASIDSDSNLVLLEKK